MLCGVADGEIRLHWSRLLHVIVQNPLTLIDAVVLVASFSVHLTVQSCYIYAAIKGTGDAVYGTSSAHALKTQREKSKTEAKERFS